MRANRRHRHQKAKTEIYLTSENTSAADAATENFADLLAESFGENTNIEGSVVRGFVIGMEGDAVIIDVGLKSEGRVPSYAVARESTSRRGMGRSRGIL